MIVMIINSKLDVLRPFGNLYKEQWKCTLVETFSLEFLITEATKDFKQSLCKTKVFNSTDY